MASDLLSVKGIGEKTIEKFNELGIHSIFELVHFLPNSYLNMDETVTLTKDTIEGYGIVYCECVSVQKSGGYGAKQYFKAICYSGGLLVSVIWYNMPYLSTAVYKGEKYKFFGKINKKNNIFEMINPLFEQADCNKKLYGIMPIYRLKGMFPQSSMKKVINNALSIFDTKSVMDIFEKKEQNSLIAALSAIHNPNKNTDLASQKEILAEDILLSKILSYRIYKSQSEPKSYKYNSSFNSDIQKLIETLPYKLTETQNEALGSLLDDMNGKHAMNRLLSGDVGSGKTIIAVLTAYYAAINGFQVAYLAPTDILARQVQSEFFSIVGVRVRVGILTSSMTAKEQRDTIADLADGRISIVVSTTSILGKRVKFQNLSYVIIDESHRFGVANRAALQHKGEKADTLVMTATPIPRSLSMLIYGEMDNTYIERRDSISDKISTIVTNDLSLCWDEVFSETAQGRQAYVVCPMIEDNEGCDLYAAKTVHAELSAGVFACRKVGLIYGSMPEKEKTLEMQKFYDGKIDILVSTTVIEVGINAPNSTVMVILNSERFGLATLHQLRGRVGRGEHKSKCFLVTKTRDNQRLRAFSECFDGMEVAEIDYAARGAGEYFGLGQSGSGEETYCKMEISRDSIISAKEKADGMLLAGDFIREFTLSPHYKVDEILQKITLN